MFLDSRCKPKFTETFIWLWMLVHVEYVCILVTNIAYKCKHAFHLLPEPAAEIFGNIFFWQGYLRLGLLNSAIVFFYDFGNRNCNQACHTNQSYISNEQNMMISAYICCLFLAIRFAQSLLSHLDAH